MEARFIDGWVRWLADVRRVRGGTLDCYSSTLSAFSAWLADEGVVSFLAVDADMVERFMGRTRRHGQIGAPATQDRDRIAISGFYKWLQSRGLATANPVMDVGVPMIRNQLPRAIPDQMWEQLWQSELPPDDRVWLGLGCFAGLRRREIASLAPEQVDNGLLIYMERKGGNEDTVEYAEMSMTIGAHLPRVLSDPGSFLALVEETASARRGERCLITLDRPATAKTLRRMSFTDPRLPDPGVLNKRLRQLLVRAELPPDAFSPHALRHTCATNLARSGVPIEVISDALGHTNIDTTRRYMKSTGRLATWRTQNLGQQVA